MKSTNPRARLSLDISQQFRDKLEKLQANTDCASITEVIRRAVAVYEGVMEYHAIGGKIILRAPNGVESALLPL